MATSDVPSWFDSEFLRKHLYDICCDVTIDENKTLEHLEQLGAITKIQRRNMQGDKGPTIASKLCDIVSVAPRKLKLFYIAVEENNEGLWERYHVQDEKAKVKEHARARQANPADDEFDLSDGIVEGTVIPSTPQFYEEKKRESFPMHKKPRGQALIINVKDVEGLTPRYGTDIDRDNLKNLLEQLYFEVKIYNDSDGLSAADIVKKVRDFSQHNSLRTAQCVMVFILSHGDATGICGTDGNTADRKYLEGLFSKNNKVIKVGTPRIFITQACRGSKADDGVDSGMNEECDMDSSDAMDIAAFTDCIFGYPTPEGYKSWRNSRDGSWYISAIVQVFMRNAHKYDICALMAQVNRAVCRRITRTTKFEEKQKFQAAEMRSSLQAKNYLYFFPGIVQ